jgi:hypothetical protein
MQGAKCDAGADPIKCRLEMTALLYVMNSVSVISHRTGTHQKSRVSVAALFYIAIHFYYYYYFPRVQDAVSAELIERDRDHTALGGVSRTGGAPHPSDLQAVFRRPFAQILSQSADSPRTKMGSE